MNAFMYTILGMNTLNSDQVRPHTYTMTPTQVDYDKSSKVIIAENMLGTEISAQKMLTPLSHTQTSC